MHFAGGARARARARACAAAQDYPGRGEHRRSPGRARRQMLASVRPIVRARARAVAA